MKKISKIKCRTDRKILFIGFIIFCKLPHLTAAIWETVKVKNTHEKKESTTQDTEALPLKDFLCVWTLVIWVWVYFWMREWVGRTERNVRVKEGGMLGVYILRQFTAKRTKSEIVWSSQFPKYLISAVRVRTALNESAHNLLKVSFTVR